MTISPVRRQLLIAGMECHQESRDMLAAALRKTYDAAERASLLIRHAEACRCVAAFEADLAKG